MSRCFMETTIDTLFSLVREPGVIDSFIVLFEENMTYMFHVLYQRSDVNFILDLLDMKDNEANFKAQQFLEEYYERVPSSSCYYISYVSRIQQELLRRLGSPDFGDSRYKCYT